MSTNDRHNSSRHAPLSMGADQFREIGHALVDQLASQLEGIPARPVTPDERASAVRDALDLNRSLPEHGTNPAELMARVVPLLFDHSLFNAHPKFFGYITAPPAPIGVLGDFLASALNPNVGSWRLSPAATEVEAQTVRWIAELIGLSPESGGLLVSGGNMANFVCFFAARAARTPWDVRALGGRDQSGRRLRVYASRRRTHGSKKPPTSPASGRTPSAGSRPTLIFGWTWMRSGVSSIAIARPVTSRSLSSALPGA